MICSVFFIVYFPHFYVPKGILCTILVVVNMVWSGFTYILRVGTCRDILPKFQQKLGWVETQTWALTRSSMVILTTSLTLRDTWFGEHCGVARLCTVFT